MSDNPITPHFNTTFDPKFVYNPTAENTSGQKFEIHQLDLQPRKAYTSQLGKSSSEVNLLRPSTNSQARSSISSHDYDLNLSSTYKYMQSQSAQKSIIDKSHREVELEQKLGMVLTQNERLNQIIEQISPLKTKPTISTNNSNVDWKEKYNALVLSTQEQRKHLNSEQDRLINDLMNKEREIHTLNERHRELVGRNLDLADENSRLKGVIQDFENTAKNRFIEVNLDMIQQNETERKLLIALNTDLQIKVMTLNEEINGYVKGLAERDAQIQFFKIELQKVLENEAPLRNEIHELKRLSQPNEPLEAKLKESQANEERLSKSNQELQEQMNKLMMDVINVHALQVQMEEMSKQQNEEKKDANSSFSESNNPAGAIIEELNTKIANLLIDNQKSNEALYEKTRENEGLLSQIAELKLQLAEKPVNASHPLNYPITNEEIADFEENRFKIIDLSAENSKLRYTITELQEEIAVLRLKTSLPSEDNSELIEQLNQRIKTLAEELHIKDSENELWRKKSEENSTASIELTQLKGQVQLLSLENENLRRNHIENEGNQRAIDQLNAKIDLLSNDLVSKETELGLTKKQQEAELSQVKSDLQEATQENEKLKISSSELTGQLEDAKRKLAEFEDKLKTVDQLSSKIRLLDMELETKRTEISILEKKASDRETGRTDLDTIKRQMILLSQENERLNDLATEKTLECDNAHQKIVELENALGGSKTLVSELAAAKQEAENVKEEYSNLLEDVEVLQRKIVEARSNEDLILSRLSERVRNQNKGNRVEAQDQ